MRLLLSTSMLVLAVAACGTTGPLSVQRAAAGQRLDPATVGMEVGAAGRSGTAPGAVGGTSGWASAAGGLAPGAVTQTETSSSGGTINRPASVQGHAPIRVGVIYASGVDSAAAAMGISGLTTGDTKAQAAAMFAWINAHGGLGGHPVQGYYYDLTQNSGSAPDAAAQAACAALTQDDHVRFVESIAVLARSEMPCFSHAGVGVLDDETPAVARRIIELLLGRP